MAVDSGQPDGPTDEVSSSSSTSADDAGHDKILTHAPVPGTTVDDAGTLFLAEQADDASKPVADPETPVPNPVTPIPTIAAVQAVNVTVKMPALDPETPVPNPVTPIPEIAIVEQAGQLQVGQVRVEQPHERAGQARHLEILAVILSAAKGLARRTQRSFAALRMTAAALRMTGGTLLTVLSREVFSSNVWGQAPLLRGVARVEVKLDGVTEVWAMLDEVVSQHYQAYRDGDKGAGVGATLDEAARVEVRSRYSSRDVV